ncbi:FAS1 domain-containing protein [Phakopsora pachyrhizi]|nr:FAS1 domain-containing protein [Phakopsora pachyrhizi]
MSLASSLSVAFVIALGIGQGTAQVPESAPACVRNCARVKIAEGYCSTPGVLTAAFNQCLSENCNSADAASGAAFANVVCEGANPNGNGSTSPPTANTNGSVAPLPVGTPSPTNGTNGNSSDFATTVRNALSGAGLNTLATLVDSPAGAAFVSSLQNGNFTLLAPSDAGFSTVPINSTSPEDLTAILNYHVIPGSLNASQLPSSGNGIVRTALRGSPYVSLPANDSQVVVLARGADDSIQIIESARNITASNFTQVENLKISIIPSVLALPETIGTTAAGVADLSTLAGAINSSDPQLFGELDQTPGITLFAPINSALSNPAQGTNFQAVLLNHIVNGSVLYSTVIANTTSVKSAGGADIEFSNNGTGTFARSGNRSIRIVRTDIITRNGVIHLVDGTFEPSNSTPTFPLINTNNASETTGIVAVDGSNSSSAAQNAATNSPALQLLPSPTNLFTAGAALTILAQLLC